MHKLLVNINTFSKFVYICVYVFTKKWMNTQMLTQIIRMTALYNINKKTIVTN